MEAAAGAALVRLVVGVLGPCVALLCLLNGLLLLRLSWRRARRAGPCRGGPRGRAAGAAPDSWLSASPAAPPAPPNSPAGSWTAAAAVRSLESARGPGRAFAKGHPRRRGGATGRRPAAEGARRPGGAPLRVRQQHPAERRGRPAGLGPVQRLAGARPGLRLRRQRRRLPAHPVVRQRGEPGGGPAAAPAGGALRVGLLRPRLREGRAAPAAPARPVQQAVLALAPRRPGRPLPEARGSRGMPTPSHARPGWGSPLAPAKGRGEEVGEMPAQRPEAAPGLGRASLERKKKGTRPRRPPSYRTGVEEGEELQSSEARRRCAVCYTL